MFAQYAVTQDNDGQRRWAESNHAFRSPFQRDRDRVVHSRAFRRLERKTQVFLDGEGDHYRTRLTHTIEVAAIARTLARSLNVNEDLSEAVALAHDLGHPPFGHMGESVLDELMRGVGEHFDHNEHSLRVVDTLERRYPGFEGLNLTKGVREALIKRRHPESSLDGVRLSLHPSLEGQIADLADDLAYYVHDVDDGLEAGLVTPGQISEQPLWSMAEERALEQRSPGDCSENAFPAFTLRCMLDMMVGDVLEGTQQRLEGWAPSSANDIRQASEPVVILSEPLSDGCRQLRQFLFEYLYRHPTVMNVNYRMGEVVRDLFSYYTRYPEKMGEGSRQRAERDGLYRAVADYIAGMTDRFALEVHARTGLNNSG